LKRKPSIIWHVHSNFPVKKNVVRRIKDRIKWSFMGRQVHVICDSDELEEIIISKRFTGRSSVVINGVDIQRVLKTTTSRQSLRESLNIPHNNLLMLSFGWSPYVKGVDILIKAAKELHRNDISILIIGKDLLNRYISKEFCKLPDNIVIAEPDECVGNLYNVADVFISASRYEGCPYSVMEAMATGLPVIASNIKAMKWARELPGITFFESENYDDLRQKILVISSMDLKRRNEISKLNSEFIKENYSTKSWVNNIINIYRGLYLNENSHFS
jgi:glycosyltransferase EpsD